MPRENAAEQDNEAGTQIAIKKKILRKILERVIKKETADEIFGNPSGCGTLDGCDQDGDGIYDWDDSDRDGDGVPNWRDGAPMDPGPRPHGDPEV